MDNQKIILTEQALLQKETINKELASKYGSNKKLKNYSLIAIPILLVLSLVFISIKERHEGSYYDDTPYAPVAAFTFFLLTPAAIVCAIIGYVKSKKLKVTLKESNDIILNLKNELIVLKNS